MKIIENYLSLLNEKFITKNKFLSISIIILLLLNFALLATNAVNNATNPEDFDTTGYLGEALFIKNHGGIVNFINLCVTGLYKQANQHPLYILLLVPFASADISFFITAKLVSILFGLLSLITVFIIAKKMFGNIAASFAVLGFLLNSVFLEQTAIVASESLLILMSTLTIYFIIKGFENNRLWIIAGVCLGLAFLAKGSALFLIPGFVLSLLITYKLKFLSNKYVWLFAGSFLLISSPLLIRNIVVYKNPLFNVNNYIGLYGKDFIQTSTYFVFNPEIGASHWRFDFQNDKSTILTKASSDPEDFFSRIFTETKLFLDTLYGSAFRLSALKRIVPLTLILFLLVGLWREKVHGKKVYIIVTIIFFLVALSFLRPINRYLLPILPFLWIYISFGALSILDLIVKNFMRRHVKLDINSFMPLVLLIIIIVSVFSAYRQSNMNNPLNSVKYPPERLKILNWLRINLKEDEVYTMGPNFNWQLERGTWVVPPIASMANFPKAVDFIKRHDIDYIIIEKKYIEYLQKGTTTDYAKYFSIDSQGIKSKEKPYNWNIVYTDQDYPIDFVIYKQFGGNSKKIN